MEFVALETERLQLVKLNTSHLDSYFTIMSKQEVMEYYGMEPLTKKEDAALIFTALDRGLALGQSIRWGITLKESGQLIGTVGLNNLSLKSKRSEIGYEIHPDFWRSGYASEAIISVVNYSFRQLDLFRIGAVTYPANTASNHLLLKLGFTLEGTLRGYLYQRSQSHDAYIFSMTRPEWKYWD